MRYIKKGLSITLLAIMMVSILTIPTSAMSSTTYSKAKAAVSEFPEVYYLVSGRKQTVYALQAYLMRFNDTCKAKLKYGNHYMDGEYGGSTKAAVAFAQSVLGVTSDGWCGKGTWTAIANSLVVNGEGLYRRYSTHGNCFAVTAPGGASDGFPALCYLDESNVAVFIESLS